MIRSSFPLLGLALLAGCVTTIPESGIAPDAYLIDAQGVCYGRTTTPAQVETVTEQHLERPERRDAEGRVIEPARYRTERRQQIVREREIVEYETPCAEAFTPDFIKSLQRALAARGLYTGPVDGVLSPQTGTAIRAFQRGFGPDSPVLSMEAAQRLGLIALDRAQISRLDRRPTADPFDAGR